MMEAAGGMCLSVGDFQHELRTSLAGIIGYSEYLLESQEDAPAELVAELKSICSLGRGMLAELAERLGPCTLEGVDERAARGAVEAFMSSARGAAEALASRCSRVSSLAGRANLHAIVPTICRMRAGCAILKQLLERPASRRALPGHVRREKPSAPGLSSPARPRILVAEASAVSRDLIRGWLSAQGFEVDEADAGRRALALAREARHDLILLGLRLPDLDGLGVLKELRREGRIGAVPILLLSAAEDAERVGACLEQGAIDYLCQPFHLSLLTARIRLCLELTRLRRMEQAHFVALEAKHA